MSHKETGDFGEQLAVEMLLQKGYTIRGRQVRTVFGEIDIIAETPQEILFIEVKTRKSSQFGVPEESITKTKRLHLARSVQSYCAEHNLFDKPFRVDAISIFLDEITHKATLRHIENILEE